MIYSTHEKENQKDRIFLSNFDMLRNQVFLLWGEMLYHRKKIVLLEARNGSGAWIRTTVRGSKGLGPAARRPPKTHLPLKADGFNVFYSIRLYRSRLLKNISSVDIEDQIPPSLPLRTEGISPLWKRGVGGDFHNKGSFKRLREGKIHSNEGIKDPGGIMGIINPTVVGSDQF